MTRWAETGVVPPATGVIVSALALPLGFRSVNNEFIDNRKNDIYFNLKGGYNCKKYSY